MHALLTHYPCPCLVVTQYTDDVAWSHILRQTGGGPFGLNGFLHDHLGFANTPVAGGRMLFASPCIDSVCPFGWPMLVDLYGHAPHLPMVYAHLLRTRLGRL